MIAPDSKTRVGGLVELSTIAGILPFGLIFKNQSSWELVIATLFPIEPFAHSFGKTWT